MSDFKEQTINSGKADFMGRRLLEDTNSTLSNGDMEGNARKEDYIQGNRGMHRMPQVIFHAWKRPLFVWKKAADFGKIWCRDIGCKITTDLRNICINLDTPYGGMSYQTFFF